MVDEETNSEDNHFSPFRKKQNYDSFWVSAVYWFYVLSLEMDEFMFKSSYIIY